MGKYRNPQALEVEERRARRRRIFTRDGWKCRDCAWVAVDRKAQVSVDSRNPPARFLTLDHVYPRSKGGGDEDSNLQTLCNRCNVKRGASGRGPGVVYV